MIQRFVIFFLALVLFAATAYADDSDVSFGGSPRMLSGQTTVTMRSELVTVDIGPDHVHVDCSFIFKNNGPACTVRMGFPDDGRGGADPSEREPGSPLKPTFSAFKSYVDGAPVDTSLVQDANNSGDLWHVKIVHFDSGQTVNVRDIYETEVGSSVDTAPNYQGGTYQVFYVLHTGSSWHGNIGRAEIVVHMDRPTEPPPYHLVSLKSLGNPDGYDIDWPKLPSEAITWRGPSTPTLDGNTVRFVREDFKPGYNDDLLLYFSR